MLGNALIGELPGVVLHLGRPVTSSYIDYIQFGTASDLSGNICRTRPELDAPPTEVGKNI